AEAWRGREEGGHQVVRHALGAVAEPHGRESGTVPPLVGDPAETAVEVLRNQGVRGFVNGHPAVDAAEADVRYGRVRQQLPAYRRADAVAADEQVTLVATAFDEGH